MPRLGPQVHCQTLEENLRGLRKRESEIKRALQRCSREAAGQCRRRRHLEQVALNVLCQSGGYHALVREFLKSNLREQNALLVTDSFTSVVAKYDAMSAADISALRECTAPENSSPQARAASRFLKESRLATWVETRNMALPRWFHWLRKKRELCVAYR